MVSSCDGFWFGWFLVRECWLTGGFLVGDGGFLRMLSCWDGFWLEWCLVRLFLLETVFLEDGFLLEWCLVGGISG